MKNFKKNTKGFTLIELLIVIAIIGLLAGVVLASLSTAKLKGQEAAIIADMNQLATTLELENQDTSTYAGLENHDRWLGPADIATCEVYFSGTGSNIVKARSICNNILMNSSGGGGDGHIFITSVAGTGFTSKKYSMMVWLPATQKYLCVGSDGKSLTDLNVWGNTGCYADPNL